MFCRLENASITSVTLKEQLLRCLTTHSRTLHTRADADAIHYMQYKVTLFYVLPAFIAMCLLAVFVSCPNVTLDEFMHV